VILGWTFSAATTTGARIVDYRCDILDAEDHIVQTHEIDCADDSQAEAAAADCLGPDPYHRSVEIWKATRRLMKVKRDAAFGLRAAQRLRQDGTMRGSTTGPALTRPAATDT
jgi:hypothetical protein